MTLLYPIWLLLAIPLGVLLLVWRPRSRIMLALRFVAWLLLLLAMCGLAIKLPSRIGSVVVVADRSLSMPPGSEGDQKEMIDLIHGQMGTADKLQIVSFGQTASVEHPPQTGKFGGFVHEVGRDASNLADAIDMGISLVPRDSPGRVLVLSDGKWTGRNPTALAARAAARGIGIDYRPLQRSSANDLAIARMDMPIAVNPKESFMMSAWVYSPVPQEITYELKRSGEALKAGKRQVVSGMNRLTFRDQAGDPGTNSYQLTITGAGDDPALENNHAKALVSIKGPKPILCVTTAAQSQLPRLLEAGGLKVTARPPERCEWSLDELSKYSAVLLENLPAEKIGVSGMETLAAWVKETGAGLMMTGGRTTYAPGGYFRSPLEPILPVSMELRREHRKLALAIVVALDRSGSMAAPVAGGKVKMDLANLGTAEVLELLGPTDEFGVLAVDSIAHVIADFGPISGEKGKIREQVLRIDAGGGGIFIFEALSNAARMILNAQSGTRHIILFADAADSEEPGQYVELIRRCREANITISVIGLGKPTDVDADLLRHIAELGGGRIFFSENPEELPRLFAQDTFVVARSTFLDEETPVRSTGGLANLAGKQYEMSQPVGGYNLCYLRPGAMLAAVTVDEYEAPLVASWQAGVGRVLCYTGEADGQYTGKMAQWKDVGDFFTSLTRWTAGYANSLPDNMLVTQEVKSGIAVVELHLDPERESEPLAGAPQITTLRGIAGRTPAVQKNAMYWSGADTLRLEVPLQGNETALSTVDVAGHGPVSLPPVCLPYSPEFKPADPDAGLVALERLARATGGKERVNVADIWKDLPRFPRLMEIGHWLLIAAIVLFLIEILERRTGFLSSRRLSLRREREIRPVRKPIRAKIPRRKRAVTPEPAGPVVEEVPTAAPVQAVEQRGAMFDALQRARHRARERTERDGRG